MENYLLDIEEHLKNVTEKYNKLLSTKDLTMQTRRKGKRFFRRL